MTPQHSCWGGFGPPFFFCFFVFLKPSEQPYGIAFPLPFWLKIGHALSFPELPRPAPPGVMVASKRRRLEAPVETASVGLAKLFGGSQTPRATQVLSVTESPEEEVPAAQPDPPTAPGTPLKALEQPDPPPKCSEQPAEAVTPRRASWSWSETGSQPQVKLDDSRPSVLTSPIGCGAASDDGGACADTYADDKSGSKPATWIPWRPFPIPGLALEAR